MIIDTFEKLPELYRWLDRSERLVLDTETTGLKTLRGSMIAGLVLGVPLETHEVKSFYVPFRHETTEPQLPAGWLRELRSYLEDRPQKTLLVGHNAKFDMKILYPDWGLLDDSKVRLHDTLQLAYCLDAERYSFALDSLAWDWLGYKSALKDWPRHTAKARGYDLENKGYSQFSVEEFHAYTANDAFMTSGIYDVMYPKLSDPEAPWWGGPDLVQVYEDDMKLYWALLRMEVTGMQLDVEKCKEISAKLLTRAAAYQVELDRLAGEAINVNSNKQLRELFHKKGWPLPYDRAEERVSFADVYLRNVPYEGADAADLKQFGLLVSNFRSAVKMKTSYFDNFLGFADEKGIIHPDFWAHGTLTGRLSCHEPAMQTIPKRYSSSITALAKSQDEIVQSEVRTVFVPRDKDHRLYSIDFKNQEVRLFVHYAEEAGMREVLESGGDVHRWTAIQMLGADSEPPHNTDAYARWRMLSKSITFGILYGMGIKKLAETLEIPREQAQTYYNTYMTTFPNVRKFMNQIIAVADQRGYIRSCFGRRLRFRKITDTERASGKIKISKGYMHIARNMQNYVCHKALNYLIQGGCADQARQAVIRCDAILRGTRSYLIDQIHDELLFELHVDEIEELLPKIKDAMTNWGTKFTVQFDVDIEKSEWDWGSMDL